MPAGKFCCWIISALFLITGILGCGRKQVNQETNKLLVFCGAANKPAMDEIALLFEKETGIRVNLTFGGSGTLLSQMELSGQGDIYLPGSPDYIAIGLRKKLLVPGSDKVVAYLVPAIITPAGNPADIRKLEDLTRPGVRVGLGNPETVCLGLYAIELLEKNELLEQVMANVVTFAGSCESTANLAAMRQVDAILGWRVFHFWNPARMDFVPIDPDRIPRLSYIPIAIAAATRDINLSRRFIDFVLSPAGKEVYAKHGYLSTREKAQEFAPKASIGGEYTLPPEYYAAVKKRFGGL